MHTNLNRKHFLRRKMRYETHEIRNNGYKNEVVIPNCSSDKHFNTIVILHIRHFPMDDAVIVCSRVG